MFIELLWKKPEVYITWVVLVVFSICVHEASHAWTAHQQGDSTAVDRGYLTLNPLKVMGQWSLLFVAFLGFAWGAVPVVPSRFKHRFSSAIVSAAGPMANVLLATIFGTMLYLNVRFFAAGESGRIVTFFFSIGLQVNLFLCIFNLLPIPILDGWEVFRLFIPPLRRIPQRQAQQYGFIALLVILFSGLHYNIWDAVDFVVVKVIEWAQMG